MLKTWAKCYCQRLPEMACLRTAQPIFGHRRVFKWDDTRGCRYRNRVRSGCNWRYRVTGAHYAMAHPSGRLRFDFTYSATTRSVSSKVAFTVKDLVMLGTLGEFEVRPPPGYVPPRDEPFCASCTDFQPLRRRRLTYGSRSGDGSAL